MMGWVPRSPVCSFLNLFLLSSLFNMCTLNGSGFVGISVVHLEASIASWMAL